MIRQFTDGLKKSFGFRYWLAAIAAMLLLTLSASAQSALTQREDNDFYRYEFSDGLGFTSTVLEGEEDAFFAAFTFDESISFSVTRDGNLFEYTQGEVIAEGGSYVLTVINIETGESALFSFSISEYAINPDGTGIDIESIFGDVLSASVPQLVEPVSSFEDGMIKYTFPDGGYFTANMPSGSISGSTVLYFSDDISAYLYHASNTPVEYKSGTLYSTEGFYLFEIYRLGTDPESGEKRGYIAKYYANVIRGPSSKIDVVNAPKDFVISSIYYQDNPIEPVNEHTAVLRRDGEYRLEYKSLFYPTVLYEVSLTRDTISPIIYFTEGALTGYSEEAVAYAKAEDDSTLTVSRDRQPYNQTSWLMDSGNYELCVSDRAGNSRTYLIEVEIPLKFGFNYKTVVFIVVLLAAAFIWLLSVRRKSRKI